MRVEEEVKLDYSDVLLRPKRSALASRRDVLLERTIKFRYASRRFNGLPIIASNMDGVGTFAMARVLGKWGAMTTIRKHYTIEDWSAAMAAGLDLRNVSVSTGTNKIWDDDAADYKLMQEVMRRWDLGYITIDVANGYQENFLDFIKRVRDEFPEKVIIAGNVITAEMTEAIILAGADVVKCGIGPGSACTTRVKAGVGYPQLSGVIECADAAHGLKGRVIADGGCTNPGDVAKAFGAGADFVMLGGMLAGHDEGEVEPDDNGRIIFYGMSSDEAMERHGARKDGYRSAEGRVVNLPYKGAVEDQLVEIVGGLRSACTYIGAESLRDMPKCTTFVRVNRTHNEVYVPYDTGKS